MGGRLTIFYEYDDPWGTYGVRLLAYRRGSDLTPDKVLPEISKLLPEPRYNPLTMLDARVSALESRRRSPVSSYDDNLDLGLANRVLEMIRSRDRRSIWTDQ